MNILFVKYFVKKLKYIAGIDEAGRGPLAGPVAVGIFCVPINSRRPGLRQRPGLCKMLDVKKIRDSKKLNEAEREKVFGKITDLAKQGKVKWHVVLVSEKIIDRKGISEAVKIGIKKSLGKVVARPDSISVCLDGGIHAPKEYLNQKTIIKGDEKVPVISFASICAKVVRDRKMKVLAKKYPEYDFGIHKGYGTRSHYEKIKKHGLSPIHRKSFLKNLKK